MNPPDVATFLGFTLDTRRQLLLRDGEPIRLRPRTYDTLVHLVRNAGRLVTKQELIDTVWKGVAVTDDSLVQCLMEIRRALGDSEISIETVRGRGYLFDAVVQWGQEVSRPGVAVLAEPPVRMRRRTGWVVGAVAAIIVAIAIAWLARRNLVGEPATVIRALAVLPLDNLSRDPDQEYFADGITDDLITELSKISALRVISRASVMRFKDTRKPLAEIARELDVDALVTGSIARSPERIRVTAQVIQISPERNIWAERYDRAAGDMIVLEGQLASEISNAIRVTLTPQERNRFARLRPLDPDAREALIKGRYFWDKRTEDGTRKAIDYYRQAAAKDPTYAPSLVGLADSYLSLALSEALQEVLPPNEAFPKAKDAVLQALKLDDMSGEAHATLGHIKFQYDRDWAGAEREFKRAIELAPNYAYAHLWYALCLMWMGRSHEALAEVSQARRLDPLLLAINANLGFILAVSHQYDPAIAECRKTLDLDPNFALAHYRLGQIYVLRGTYAEAIPELERAIALSGGSPRAIAELGLAQALAGHPDEARRLIAQLAARSKERYVSPFNLAVIYGGLGDATHTLDWLEKADREGSPSLNFLVLSPAFAVVRSDVRFTALVKHLGLGILDAQGIP